MAKSVSVRAGRIEFLKVNTGKWEWRDAYHWVLALNWPRFIALILGVYITINLLFAALYRVGGDCIAGMTRGSFLFQRANAGHRRLRPHVSADALWSRRHHH